MAMGPLRGVSQVLQTAVLGRTKNTGRRQTKEFLSQRFQCVFVPRE